MLVILLLICEQGHDTTAAASSFFLSLLGVHEEIQEKCVAELREIFGDSERPVTFQDTLEMKYLERCIMETLRLFPPVPIIARHVKENVKLRKLYNSGDRFAEDTLVELGKVTST